MENELSSLGNTYEECIAVQEKVITNYRLKLNEARSKYNMKEIQRLNSLLRILYDEKMELQMTAHQIQKYLS